MVHERLGIKNNRIDLSKVSGVSRELKVTRLKFFGFQSSLLAILFLSSCLVCCSNSFISFIRLKTFKFIKAVSNTVLDMINAAYHDKPLERWDLIGVGFFHINAVR